MKIRTKDDLDRIRESAWRELRSSRAASLWFGMASCGIAAGAEEVYRVANDLIGAQELPFATIRTGCLGLCQKEPLVELRTERGERFLYGEVRPGDLPELLGSIQRGIPGDSRKIATLPALPSEPPSPEMVASWIPDHPFYRHQIRNAGRNCGLGDPENIRHAFALGAYQGLARCLLELSPGEVIDIIKESGLRGRGGAGYPTGRKWELTRDAAGETRYVICNADEGDPGAYMDRSLLEGDPHGVLEGMIIGAYAVGARQGFIYVRMEYPLAVRRLIHAIEEARACGLIGEDVLGSGFSFEVEVVEGAGAFVSGEETALIASIEGGIAEPRPRPPYPAVKGLHGCPTVINNVETWANVPLILEEGPAWFARHGTERSKGTKIFSLVGSIRYTGLVEVPLGTPLRRIVEDIGGGAPAGRRLKAVQTGGPSGGCIPAERFDLPVDYEDLAALGSIMGSGGLVVLDDGACMVDIARYFLEFTGSESCGKCTPCREGLDRMAAILTGIASGQGTIEDLDRLEELALGVRDASFCGLGKSAPNPVLTTLKYFRAEVLAHIEEKRCPAGVCRELIRFAIDPEACTGCGACLQVCPAEAISGEKEGLHELDPDRCIKCGACREVCPSEAVIVG